MGLRGVGYALGHPEYRSPLFICMLTAGSAFAFFTLLALASVVYYLARRFRLPYTVLLTLFGVLLVPLSTIEPFSFFRELSLTPELLFFIFLPTLLFETAYNMNIRRVVDEFTPIMLLSVLGYLASSFLIGGGLYVAFDFLGLGVPFLITLLFGALISATDPVAVLALFKEYGAPRRLSLIFEGESLMNDATALALFVVVLSLIDAGLSGGTLTLGALTFVTMLVGGALLGLLVGLLFTLAIGVFKNNEIVAITLMIVLAHSTFLLAEIANHELRDLGLAALQFSPIIATTAASLLMGNYGRFKVLPRAEEFIEKFWSQFAFMANSVVFILVGFLFASVPSGTDGLLLPVVLTVLVVAAARALSIYGTLIPFNILAPQSERIPASWQHLLAWGSLRGALAVMLVLLIPANLTVPGWSLALSVQEFLLVLTVSCIFVTLFIKAPTIGPLIRKLKLDELTPLETVASLEARALIYGATVLKLRAFAEKGYIPDHIAARLIATTEERFNEAVALCQREGIAEVGALAERALGLYIIGLEKEVLKELLTFSEVGERTFKQLYGKLTIQSEAIERGDVDPSGRVERDHRDFFENIAAAVYAPFRKSTRASLIDEYLFHRTQAILARKVLKELAILTSELETPVFTRDTIERARAKYATYHERAHNEAKRIHDAHEDAIGALDETLAYRSMYRVEERVLERLLRRELVSPKLYIALHHEYEEEVERVARELTQRSR